jgi:hypothetical protein
MSTQSLELLFHIPTQGFIIRKILICLYGWTISTMEKPIPIPSIAHVICLGIVGDERRSTNTMEPLA